MYGYMCVIMYAFKNSEIHSVFKQRDVVVRRFLFLLLLLLFISALFILEINYCRSLVRVFLSFGLFFQPMMLKAPSTLKPEKKT
ncbi:hypothetical protein BY458DRAFT_513575 [Sporodiniella umbellata]|nr:hypothetical protein BY458DRAFT_513575 [Sporodiniella umbellata]